MSTTYPQPTPASGPPTGDGQHREPAPSGSAGDASADTVDAAETTGSAEAVGAVDAERWPDVALPPSAPALHTAVARALVHRAVDRLPLTLRLPDGTERGLGGPVLRLHDPEAFHRRIARGGLIGFGESYMAGEWDARTPGEDAAGPADPATPEDPADPADPADTDQLAAVLAVFATHVATLIPAPLRALRGVWAARQPREQRNTPTGARDNIGHHYDLSNELFALFLDETLTYSSALFDELPSAWGQLAPAQNRKIERLLDLAEVGEGTRLLEIGTGWGELALQAARRGAQVTTLTLSREQQELARARIAAAGLSDRVDVQLTDYREAEGSYDAIVSVEMIEAVGAEFWPVYFRTLDERLAPGGHAVLQAITMPHHRMRTTRTTHTWIQKYIFPGGLIPSVEAIEASVRDTALTLDALDAHGPHYAETLRLWRERFHARREEVAALGFDATFHRMWDLYLAYSEAGFRTGYLDLHHLHFTKGLDR